MTLSFILAALAILPADRLAMADGLFNKGRYAEAVAEYRALANEPSVAKDELLYRFAECERSLGERELAQKHFAEVFTKHPASRHAPRSRFMHAMGLPAAERAKALAALDDDGVAPDIRSAALYYLGAYTGDIAALERCVKTSPQGRYAPYADLRRATILSESKETAARRKGLELLLGLAFGNKGELSEEALYLAAAQSYRERKYDEAGNLFGRYLKTYANGSHAGEVRKMSVWCDYMSGRYAAAAAACGDGATDDFAYLKAASAYAAGDGETALALFRKYLADYPAGRYRADAALPAARLELAAAEKAGDEARMVECAKRCCALSKGAADALRLAWICEKTKKTSLAVAEYQRIAREFPGSAEAAEALYRKAMTDAREDRWAAAELSLAEALATGKCGKYRGEALYWRGVAALRLDHAAEAAGFMREALKENLPLGEQREARLIVADADLNAGRTEEAKTAYAKLVTEGACDRMSASKVLAVGKLLDGDEAKACAKNLIGRDSPEWRQSGYALLGTVENRRESFTAAMDAYRKCMAEKASVGDLGEVALRLGILETRAGELERAEETLKKAVELNRNDAGVRGAAYLALARNSVARGDSRSACAYATVVTTLYADKELCAAAQRILKEHSEKAR